MDFQPNQVLAADQLKRYVRQVAAGAPPALFQRLDETGRPFDLAGDYASGGYLILVFLPSLDDDALQDEILGFESRAETFRAARAHIVFVTAQSSAGANADAKRRLGLSFPALADPGGYCFAAYGLHKIGGRTAPTKMRSVALTPYRQLRCWWDIEMTQNHAEQAETLITNAQLAEEMAWAPPHPPVLIVPSVFSREECAAIIREFEINGELIMTPSQRSDPQSAFKTPIYEYDRQDRIDHIVVDQKQLAFIDARLVERVFPEIKRAFAFDVNQRENIAIARYAGAREGVEIGHRDNKSAQFHRRFALSLSLNDEYEGGGVVFREYSNRPYRLPAGSALVFSSSLLHEVEETTSGVRYNMLSHFFNDASAAEAARR